MYVLLYIQCLYPVIHMIKCSKACVGNRPLYGAGKIDKLEKIQEDDGALAADRDNKMM